MGILLSALPAVPSGGAWEAAKGKGKGKGEGWFLFAKCRWWTIVVYGVIPANQPDTRVRQQTAEKRETT